MTTGYTRTQIAIHWAVAVLIITNYFIADGMGDLLDKKLGGAAVANPWHVWIGLAVLALVILRLIVRFSAGAPAAAGVPGSLTQRLAGWGHALLYVIMVAVPLGGAIVWFGGVDALGQGHVLAGNALMILIAGHAIMGLYHQYVVKDGALLRMMRPR